MIAALMAATVGVARLGILREWEVIRGKRDVKSWKVNGDCTRLRVQPRKGKVRNYLLRENKFEATLFDFHSALDLGDSRLVVAHGHGGFIVDDWGHILHHFWINDLIDSPSQPKYLRVTSKIGAGTELVPGFLDVTASNGRTIVFSGTPFRSMILLTTSQLKPVCVVDYSGTLKRLSAIPGGWKCDTGHTVFSVSNTGDIRLMNVHQKTRS